MKIKDLNKIKTIIYKIIYYIIIVCIIYHVLYLISTLITNKDYFNIGNFGLIIVKEDNMKKAINKNDIVIITKNIKDLKENDIIALNKNNETIISRIYKIEGLLDKSVFIKGDNNLYPSSQSFYKESIEGKVNFKIPLLGCLLNFLQNKIMTLISIILLILKFKINKEIKRRKKLVLSIDKTIKS